MEPVTTDINMASLLLATAAILVTILGSTITTVVLIFRQFNHLDTKIGRLDTKFDTKIDGLDKSFETRIDGLDKKFETRIDGLDKKFDTKIDGLDTKFDTKFDGLDAKFDTRIDGLDKKFETRIDGLDKKFTGEFRTVHGELRIMRREISNVGERLARVEGHLMGPESFSPSPLPPPPDELDDSARQAI